jgi:hypothetical protein
VKPVTCQFEFVGWSDVSHRLHPNFVALRDDKTRRTFGE